MGKSKKSQVFPKSKICIYCKIIVILRSQIGIVWVVRRVVYILCCIMCVWFTDCSDKANSNDFAQQCYAQGRHLREAGEPAAAMQQFVDAVQSGADDHLLLGRIYSNMANMCRQAERHPLAYEMYALSTGQFLAAEDTLAVAYALNNMAWEQAVMGHKDSALALIDSAVQFCPVEPVRSKVFESRAAACLYAGEYDSVICHARHFTDTLYADMLMAQAFAFTHRNDSALWYAEQVTKRTTNPRYLDDAYYILAHCDSTAERAELVEWTETRTDVQRQLEQYKSQMAQAVLLLQQNRSGNQRNRWFIVAVLAVLVSCLVWLGRLRIRIIRRRKIERLTLQLPQSNPLRQDIPWDIYQLPDKLRERGLSDREIRIATLVLFGFSYAQMAELLHRAENGIGKDKYLIAKKLNVSVKDLQNILINIACRN